MDRSDDRAGLVVEAVFRPRVSDPLDRLANYFRDLHVAFGRDLPCHEGKPRGQKCLARNPAHRVLRQERVKDRIGDLIGYLVRMSLGNRLRGKEKVPAAAAVAHLLPSRP